MANNWNINTDDYDLYTSGDSTEALPGSPTVDEQGNLHYEDYFFPMSTVQKSMMDQDPNNTGPTNDFWTDYPISIDINGYIFYNGENTGINVRGPAGISAIAWDDLTEEQKASLKGQDGRDGVNGINGQDGKDGINGLSAYEVWLDENGWLDNPDAHPVSDFYQYIANLANGIIKQGAGNGSILMNYKGNNNIANGAGATASGYYTQANGNNSFSSGYKTIANYANQFVVGKNNTAVDKPFIIGNGQTDLDKSNAFSVDWSGNVIADGEISDGNGNILSNKIDKVVGKQLSTYDFNDTYKNFIDNYTVDTELIPQSLNPVTNKAIYEAIEQVSVQSGKPVQNLANTNQDLSLLYAARTTDGTLDEAKYDASLTWNPALQSIKKGITSTYSNIIGFGDNLVASENNQVILGKYNEAKANDFLEIGYGNAQNRSNILELSKTGNLTISGDITNGNGETLSGKQNILTYDAEPTVNSLNIVRSGDLYTYFVDNVFDKQNGYERQIASLQSTVASLQTRITTLETIIAAYGNPHEITDDTYTSNVYIIGIDKDEFYIKLKGSEESEEEIEGDTTDANNNE